MSEPIASALRSGDSETALNLAHALVASAPQNAESHYWLALALQAKRNSAGAIAAIDEAIRLAPNNDHFNMLRSMLQLGQADVSEVQAGLMDALALNPNQIEAYCGLIHIAVGQNNLPEAERLLRLAERVDAEHDNVLVAKAALLQKQGDLDTALKCLTQAAQANPKNVMALCNLGSVYLQKDMPAFAEQALQRAFETAPKNPAVLNALIHCQLTLHNVEAAAKTLDTLLEIAPEDLSARALRIQMRERHQDFTGALSDAKILADATPGNTESLALLSRAYFQNGDPASACALLDEALAKQPGNDQLWQMRAGIETHFSGDARSKIESWLASCPHSALAHEAMAVYLEATGNLPEAGVAADAALALSEALPMAQFVKLRQEVREKPEAALDRLVRLAAVAKAPEARRMVLAWIGIANDRLGQYAAAAEAFGRMSQLVLPQKTLPTPYPAHDKPAEPIQGRLLWSPVGVRIEPILSQLAPILGKNLLADRNQASEARDDGFGPFRAEPDSEQAGSALTWSTGILAMGLQPAEVVDWLPQWDGYTAAALDGAELTAIITDPRDAFLNWMVFGSAQSYVFVPNIKQSAKWLAAGYYALADSLAQNPDRVRVVKLDALESDAAAIASTLQTAFGLRETPDAELLAKPVLALGGMPNQFPAGHWRHYRDNFTEAFALLTPIAVRLGYPEV